MCGIAGIVGVEARGRLECLKRMVMTMAHRGPDGEGLYTSPTGRCLLGHRRLSVLDLTEAASQPMLSADGQTVIAYNGECYNHLELRRALDGQHPWVSGSDTETVLYLLQKRGMDALPDLKGMFALAVWSEKDQLLTLVRDRFGIKPLYYVVTRAGQLLFASEIRALLASGIVEPCIDRASLHEFLMYGFVGEPNSIIEGVHMVRPGSCLEFHAGDGRIVERSFHGGLTQPSRDPELSSHLCDTFNTAVRSHLISDVPIGAFLSSGIDSSAIIAAMAAVGGTDIRTLTVSFPDAPDCSEGAEAAAWARRCGANHTDIPMTGGDLLKMLPMAIAAQDQPTTDAVNTYVVSAAARTAGLTVALSGLGGDELFGGYPTTRDVPKAMRLRRRLGPLAPPLGWIVQRLSDPTHRRPSKIADLLTTACTTTSIYGARRRMFSPFQVARLAPALDGHGCGVPGADSTANSLSIADAVSLLDQSCYMRCQLLRDSDTMGMARSLEIRVPFLDNDLVDVAWNMGETARDGKRTLVSELKDLLPQGILDRPKRGFTMPFSTWMCGPLRSTVEESLHALPSVFDMEFIDRLWQSFLERPEVVGWSRPWALFVLSEYVRGNKLTL